MVSHRARGKRLIRHAAYGLCNACYWAGRENRRCRHLVDDVAVERAIFEGDARALTRAERFAVVEYSIKWGWSTDETARRLGCTERTVVRYRALIKAASRG